VKLIESGISKMIIVSNMFIVCNFVWVSPTGSPGATFFNWSKSNIGVICSPDVISCLSSNTIVIDIMGRNVGRIVEVSPSPGVTCLNWSKLISPDVIL
jgi:hypothetical protein